jgi:hypothetical protein
MSSLVLLCHFPCIVYLVHTLPVLGCYIVVMIELNPILSFQQKNISLDYYLFQLMSHPVSDGHNKYDNYFDVSIDALVTALTKAGFRSG